MHHRGWLAIDGRAPDGLRFEWKHRPGENAHVGENHRHQFDDAVIRAQAGDALVGLGWKPAIARRAVDEACAHAGTGLRIEQLITEALRRCPKPLG